MKTRNVVLKGLVFLTAGAWLTGCATNGEMNHAGQGAVLGSLLGAGLGAVIGHQSGETGEGAAIGAAVGAAGGYVLGNEQDKTELHSEAVQATQTANQASQMASTVTVNLTNSNGSITPVTLRRQGNEYIGPKGEHYLQVPTPEQLRSVYGF